MTYEPFTGLCCWHAVYRLTDGYWACPTCGSVYDRALDVPYVWPRDYVRMSGRQNLDTPSVVVDTEPRA